MAENTRSKQDTKESKQRKAEDQERALKQLSDRLDQMSEMLRTVWEHQQQHFPENRQEREHENNDNRRALTRGIKLDFPHFDGSDPAGWVFKADHYFEFHQTHPSQKLLMAAYHMQGEALIWYKGAWDSGQFNSWETFTRILQLRFGPTTYDDPMEALTRLKQTTTVAAYQTQFEALSNRINGLSDAHKLSCFISGLKDDVRLLLKMFNPT
ncbi:hypothetical protein F2P56_032077, partial [Juglans regia]